MHALWMIVTEAIYYVPESNNFVRTFAPYFMNIIFSFVLNKREGEYYSL